jgi:uncharacterized protein with GYD domain
VAVGRIFAVPFAFGTRASPRGAALRYLSGSCDHRVAGEEKAMPTYIAFGNWTDQGVRAIAESPQRLDAAKRQLEEMGGRFVDFWMTMGEHDMVLVYETPDDAVAARFTLVLNGLGSVRTRTMKAFPEAAYRGIVASLG